MSVLQRPSYAASASSLAERLARAPLVAGVAALLIVLRLWFVTEENRQVFEDRLTAAAQLQSQLLVPAVLEGDAGRIRAILELAALDSRMSARLTDMAGAPLGQAGPAPEGGQVLERVLPGPDGVPLARLTLSGGPDVWHVLAGDLVMILLASVLAVALAALYLRHRIGRPLGMMLTVMEQIDSRHWHTVDWVSHGQLGRVVAAFNAMIGRLSAEQRDIGEAMRAAERAARTKDAFLAQIGHDLRTPLTAILGFSEVLKDELFGRLGSERYRDYAAGIHRSGERLRDVIEGMLHLPEDVASLELIERAFDPGATVENVVQLIRTQADRAGIAIVTEVQPQLPRLLGDELRMKQALAHLLSNALRFTREGGEIWIAVRNAAGGGVDWVVGDTGAGQVDDDSRLDPGALGLPLVRALCELHQAQVSLESAAGVGTLVTIHFPAERVVARS